MTLVVTPVVSVHYDERPHEWRAVHDARGYPQLIDDIVTPPPAGSPAWVHGHRTVVVSEHPYDLASAKLTPMLLVAVTVGYGAAYFREVDHGIVTGWITSNQSPIPTAPKLAFVGQGWTDFPPAAVVTTDRLRGLVAEYLATGRRLASIRWQESEWVQ